MSAGGCLQTAVASALGQVGILEGVFDGPPARAPFPYAVIDASLESDWSHKSGEGREVTVAITVWDEQPIRLRWIADDVELRMRALAEVQQWQLVSMRLVRRRIVRDVAGPWAAVIDFRARLLAAA